MREVDEHAEVLAQVDPLQPAPDAIETGQPRSDLIDWDADREADTGRAKCVVDVESRRDRKRHLGLTHRRLEPEPGPGRGHAQVERVQVGSGGQAVRPPSRDRPP